MIKTEEGTSIETDDPNLDLYIKLGWVKVVPIDMPLEPMCCQSKYFISVIEWYGSIGKISGRQVKALSYQVKNDLERGGIINSDVQSMAKISSFAPKRAIPQEGVETSSFEWHLVKKILNRQPLTDAENKFYLSNRDLLNKNGKIHRQASN